MFSTSFTSVLCRKLDAKIILRSIFTEVVSLEFDDILRT